MWYLYIQQQSEHQTYPSHSLLLEMHAEQKRGNGLMVYALKKLKCNMVIIRNKNMPLWIFLKENTLCHMEQTLPSDDRERHTLLANILL